MKLRFLLWLGLLSPCFAQLQSAPSVTITASGGTAIVSNTNGALQTTWEEIPFGGPATVSVTIQGCMKGGTCDTAADTNTTTTATIRAVTFAKVYTYFLITASWTGGTAVSITVNPALSTAVGASGGGSGTVTNTAGNLTSNAVVLGAGTNDTKVSTAFTTDGAAALTVGVAAGGNGVIGIAGNTSGTATFTAPTIAGTNTNPVIASNVLQLPDGTSASPHIHGTTSTNSGVYYNTSSGVTFTNAAADVMAIGSLKELLVTNAVLCWQSSFAPLAGTCATGISKLAAAANNVLAFGNGTATDETTLLRWGGPCKVTADITLTVNTAITICTWSFPAVAKAWGWSCQIPWVISAGTGTNTLAIGVSPSQTPTGATNGTAEIKTTNSNTATEATTAVSASGATILLTSPTITPAATVFQSSTSGTLLASATAGTFAIQMTAAGTTATALAKAGAVCVLY